MRGTRGMAVHYTNRIGKIYYLREGKTKTGKPRYFFSTRQRGKGSVVDQIPEGYEIYEHPENAQVFLRKTRPQLITDLEKQIVKKAVNALQRSRRYIIDCKDEYITIYESSIDVGELNTIFSDFLKHTPLRPGRTADDAMNALVSAADQNYTAMLRFGLFDKERRTFTAERFCFRGAIDDWINLGGPEHLKTLVDMYVELLGTDDFFDAPFF
jgi:hypothetical protein